MALEKELQTYRERLPELFADEGKFVLVHDQEMVGIYAAYEDAIQEGYNRFGLSPFLVRKIESIEHVQFVTRDLAECRT